MMNMVERIILESLGTNPKSLPELVEDTGLGQRILINTLRSLLKSKMVYEYDKCFRLNMKMLAKFNTDKRDEVKELMDGIVDQYFDRQGPTISLKKVWMSEQDEKIFKTLLAGMDRFLSELKHYNKTPRPLCEKKIFYWGMSPYKKALDGQLRSV